MADDYWLPDNHHVKLTAFELGYLRALLEIERRKSDSHDMMVYRRGPAGERIPITMIELLIEKVNAAFKPEGESQ